MRHIQYQGETLPPSSLPPFPLVLAFHLVLGNFYIHPKQFLRQPCAAQSGQLSEHKQYVDVQFSKLARLTITCYESDFFKQAFMVHLI